MHIILFYYFRRFKNSAEFLFQLSEMKLIFSTLKKDIHLPMKNKYGSEEYISIATQRDIYS